MAQPKITAQDKKWAAQDDAHTLARAEEIHASKPRMNAAKKEAKIMLKEQEARITGLKKVAKAPAKAAPKARAKARKK